MPDRERERERIDRERERVDRERVLDRERDRAADSRDPKRLKSDRIKSDRPGGFFLGRRYCVLSPGVKLILCLV